MYWTASREIYWNFSGKTQNKQKTVASFGATVFIYILR